uniref:Uncharacterized protein n=1 Tax=Arcella intermedia TaxID=1963864 RepID=A0A6B2LX47_9EUKA
MDLEGERQVAMNEGIDLANNWGCPYFEVSAKTRHNVVESIEALVREVNRILGPPAGKSYKRQKGGCTLL